MKRVGCLVLLILFCSLVGKGWHWAKDGFSLNRTLSVRSGSFLLWGSNLLAFDKDLKVGKSSDLSKEVETALQQPYTYLGRGHQCYAFSSLDGRYVIKLPRYDRYRLSFFLRSFPFSWLALRRDQVRADIEGRLQFLLSSFHLAFEELKEETALLYLHLNRSDHISFPLLIQDRLGRSYKLDLNKTSFILQEKKPIMMACFRACLQRGDRESAKKIIEEFLQVIATRSQKGIYNKDPSFLRNFGWDGNKGFQIDIGSFYRKNKDIQNDCELSFEETVNHVRRWLAETDKEMLDILNQKVQDIQQSWGCSH